MTQIADEQAAPIITRLRRVEGQIRGIQRMLEEGRDCLDIVRQLAAARTALDRTGNVIVSTGLRGCLNDAKLDPAALRDLDAALDALASLRG